MIESYPFGKAPFWLTVVGVGGGVAGGGGEVGGAPGPPPAS